MSLDAPFSLGPWRIDPVANEVRHGDAVVRLEPKAVAVLVHLAARPGEVVTREALMDAVWPDVVVTDASLTRCVSQIRQALGDDARGSGLIETIPTVGYRLHPPAPAAVPSTEAPATAVTSQPPAPLRRGLWVVLGLAVVAALLVAPALWRRPAAPLVVQYRVEASGAIDAPDVTVTTGVHDLHGGPIVTTEKGFQYRRTVAMGEDPPRTFRLLFQGRTTRSDVLLEVVVRRGEEIVAEQTATGFTDADTPTPFSFSAMAQVDD